MENQSAGIIISLPYDRERFKKDDTHENIKLYRT